MLRPCLMIAAALVGCANSGDEGFVVINATAAPAGCLFVGDTSQPFIAKGAIAVQSPAGYLLFPLLESRVTAMAGQEPQRTIELHGARIDLSVASSTVTDTAGQVTDKPVTLEPIVTHFKQLVSGSLTPNGGTVNVTIEIVPHAALAQIAAQIDPMSNYQAVLLANIVMYGDMGGSEVDALPFQFPIDVVPGTGTNVLGACPQTPKNMGNSCNPFQDGIVDCCTNTTGQLVCPAQ